MRRKKKLRFVKMQWFVFLLSRRRRSQNKQFMFLLYTQVECDSEGGNPTPCVALIGAGYLHLQHVRTASNETAAAAAE
jgi:hypothetical protein